MTQTTLWPLVVAALTACSFAPAEPSAALPNVLPATFASVPQTLDAVFAERTLQGERLIVRVSNGPAGGDGWLYVSNGQLQTDAGNCYGALRGDCLDVTAGSRSATLHFRFDSTGAATVRPVVPLNLPDGTYVGQVGARDTQGSRAYTMSAPAEFAFGPPPVDSDTDVGPTDDTDPGPTDDTDPGPTDDTDTDTDSDSDSDVQPRVDCAADDALEDNDYARLAVVPAREEYDLTLCDEDAFDWYRFELRPDDLLYVAAGTLDGSKPPRISIFDSPPPDNDPVTFEAVGPVATSEAFTFATNSAASTTATASSTVFWVAVTRPVGVSGPYAYIMGSGIQGPSEPTPDPTPGPVLDTGEVEPPPEQHLFCDSTADCGGEACVDGVCQVACSTAGDCDEIVLFQGGADALLAAVAAGRARFPSGNPTLVRDRLRFPDTSTGSILLSIDLIGLDIDSQDRLNLGVDLELAGHPNVSIAVVSALGGPSPGWWFRASSQAYAVFDVTDARASAARLDFSDLPEPGAWPYHLDLVASPPDYHLTWTDADGGVVEERRSIDDIMPPGGLRLILASNSPFDNELDLTGLRIVQTNAGYCDTLAGVCKPKLQAGDICLFLGNDACATGACDTVCVGCTATNGCAEDEFCNAAVCEPKRAAGEECQKRDVRCLSGSCGPTICEEEAVPQNMLSLYECTGNSTPSKCDECVTDDQCPGDEFCHSELNTCERDLPNGYGCGRDAQCASSICDLTCVECTALPEQGCDFATQYCEFANCLDKGPTGADCAFGDQCLSDLCNVLTGECGDCDAHTDCASSEYCDFTTSVCTTKQADGAACPADDRYCASGICDTLTCVDCTNVPQEGCNFSTQYCEFQQCKNKGGTGADCAFADQCTSGICNVLTGECGNCDAHSDCSSSQYCDFTTSVCTAKQADGAACPADDRYCASGICDTTTCVDCTNVPKEGCNFSTQYCEFQQCKNKGGTGADCAFADQCTSGICNVLTGECGNCDAHSDCSSSQYCDFTTSVCTTKQADGAACPADDRYCASGICDSTTCVDCTAVPQEGCNFSTQYCEFQSCYDKGAVGESCLLGDQCASGICNLLTGKCGNCDGHNDCSSGQYCDITNSLCRTRLGNGSACPNDDRFCSSGVCDTVICVECTAIPAQGCNFSTENCVLGNCQSKAANGSVCAVNSDCLSGSCVLFTCR